MKMLKKLVILIIVFSMILSIVGMTNVTNATSFADINRNDIFVKQQTRYTCTLAASVMLVRRASILAGKSNWASVTESSMRSTAWDENGGLWFTFTYNGINIKHGQLSGNSLNKNTIISLLSNHPEGIVAYDTSMPHAVLITDYANGIFYCADPDGSSKGRVPLINTTIKGSNQDEKISKF